MKVTEVASGIFLIDCYFAGLPEQCGVFLIRGERNVLVDAGPTTGLGEVAAALDHLGVAPADLGYVALTHFHLDHAGGTAALLERSPQAKVLVHAGSVKYLADPARLVKSAHRALGKAAQHYGTMLPVEPERIRPLSDGYELDLGGGRVLQAVYTPGHCGGHYAFLLPDRGVLFCGDALGHFVQEHRYVYPAMPAPEFDLDASLASADAIAGMQADTLCFPHFGSSSSPGDVVDAFKSQLRRFVAMADEVGDQGDGARVLAERMMRDMPWLGEAESEVVRCIQEVNAAGMLHYLRDRRD